MATCTVAFPKIPASISSVPNTPFLSIRKQPALWSDNSLQTIRGTSEQLFHYIPIFRWVPLILKASPQIQMFIAGVDYYRSSCGLYSSASFSNASSYAVEAHWDQPARQTSGISSTVHSAKNVFTTYQSHSSKFKILLASTTLRQLWSKSKSEPAFITAVALSTCIQKSSSTLGSWPHVHNQIKPELGFLPLTDIEKALGRTSWGFNWRDSWATEFSVFLPVRPRVPWPITRLFTNPLPSLRVHAWLCRENESIRARNPVSYAGWGLPFASIHLYLHFPVFWQFRHIYLATQLSSKRFQKPWTEQFLRINRFTT